MPWCFHAVGVQTHPPRERAVVSNKGLVNEKNVVHMLKYADFHIKPTYTPNGLFFRKTWYQKGRTILNFN